MHILVTGGVVCFNNPRRIAAPRIHFYSVDKSRSMEIILNIYYDSVDHK